MHLIPAKGFPWIIDYFLNLVVAYLFRQVIPFARSFQPVLEAEVEEEFLYSLHGTDNHKLLIPVSNVKCET